jgi:hypothetical protein
MRLLERPGVGTLALRMALGFGFGLLFFWFRSIVGFSILLYLAGLGIGSALLSFGLGRSRLLVMVAIWLAQYLYYYLLVIAGANRSAEIDGALFFGELIFIFPPAIAIFVAGYAELLAERIRRVPD